MSNTSLTALYGGVANAPLGNEQIAALLNWLVETFGGPQTPSEWQRFTAGEVALERRSPLLDVEGVRAELLLELNEDD